MDIKAYIESGVIESYVLGMADAQEAAELLQLSAQYPEIKQAVSAFEASLEKSALANAIAPPAFVKEKIFSALQEEFAAKKTTATVIDMPSASTNWLRYIAVASVILLIGSSVLNVYYFNKFNEVNNKYASLLNDKNSLEASINIYKTKTLDIYNSMQLMSDPMMIKVSMPGVKGKDFADEVRRAREAAERGERMRQGVTKALTVPYAIPGATEQR